MNPRRTKILEEMFKTGKYHCTALGEIYGPNGIRKLRQKRNGYLHIGVSKNLNYYVHQMIWVYFKGAIPSGLEINHIDGNKKNNSLNNLELVSHKKNSEHAAKLGLMPRGSKSHLSKINEEVVLEIRKMHAAGVMGKDIAKRFKLSCASISLICNWKSWKHVC